MEKRSFSNGALWSGSFLGERAVVPPLNTKDLPRGVAVAHSAYKAHERARKGTVARAHTPPPQDPAAQKPKVAGP